MQLPRVVPVVRYGETLVLCDHVRVYGEDGLRIRLDPRHLKESIKYGYLPLKAHNQFRISARSSFRRVYV